MTLTTISPGVDTEFSTKLNDNFDFNSKHIIEMTDTSSSNLTSTSTWELVRTFSATSVSSDFIPTKITFSGTFSGASGSTNYFLGYILYDGTNYYSTSDVGEFNNLNTVSSGNPSVLCKGYFAFSTTINHGQDIPVGLINSNNLTVYVYLKQDNVYTAVLDKGFTINIEGIKSYKSEGSVSQS